MFQSDSKTFQFVSQNARPASTMPSAGAQKKIRVAHGNKAVSPVKSRPKKREKLEKSPTSPMSMETIAWSDVQYDVQKSIEHLGSKFPLMVSVTKGIDAADETALELERGTILQIHSYGEQERVKAKNSYGQMLSIPLLYPAMVRVITGNSSNENQSLAEAVRSYPLPLRVIVQSLDENVDAGDVNIYGMELSLIGSYTELFIRGNTISEGWIDQANICVVPASLDVRFSQAIGMNGATTEEWTDFSKMFARSVRHLNYDFIDGIQGVMILDRSRVTSKAPPVVESPPNEEQVYENMPGMSPNLNDNRRKIITPIKTSDISVHVNKSHEERNMYNNASFEPDSPGVPPKQQNLPPKRVFSLNLPKVLPDLSPHQKAAAVRQEAIYDNHRQVKKPDNDKGRSISESDEHRGNTIASGLSSRIQVSYNNKNALFSNHKSPEQERERTPPPSRPNKGAVSPVKSDSGNEEDVAEMFDNVIRLASEERSSVRNMAGRFERPKQEAGRWSSGHHQSDTPRAVVQPNVHNRPTTQQSSSNVLKVQNQPNSGPFISAFQVNMKTLEPNNKGKGRRSGQKDKTFQSMADVPSNISGLTVGEVSQCLRLLKMDDYVKPFASEQIDGRLLGDLNEESLRKDFKMTDFVASKLVRFVKGWRPKIS